MKRNHEKTDQAVAIEVEAVVVIVEEVAMVVDAMEVDAMVVDVTLAAEVIESREGIATKFDHQTLTVV
jgi:hypothetical protein